MKNTVKQDIIATRGTAAVKYYELARDARADGGESFSAGTRCTQPQVTHTQHGSYVETTIAKARVRFRLGS